MKINELFRENLKRYRAKTGLTQQKLAEIASVTVTALRDYETGRRAPPMETMGQIAAALGVKVSDLFESDDPAPVLTMPVSKTLQKLMAIPDRIYDLAQSIPLDDKETWENVEAALEEGIEQNKLAQLHKT